MSVRTDDLTLLFKVWPPTVVPAADVLNRVRGHLDPTQADVMALGTKSPTAKNWSVFRKDPAKACAAITDIAVKAAYESLVQAKPVDKPAEKPAEKPEEKPVDKPAEKPARKPAEKPARKPVDKPAEKPARKPAEKPARKPVDKPAEKPVPPPDVKAIVAGWASQRRERAPDDVAPPSVRPSRREERSRADIMGRSSSPPKPAAEANPFPWKWLITALSILAFAGIVCTGFLFSWLGTEPEPKAEIVVAPAEQADEKKDEAKDEAAPRKKTSKRKGPLDD